MFFCVYLGVKKRKKIMNLIKLNSVGCVIDENGVTYPMLADGLGIDNDGACHINDLTTLRTKSSLMLLVMRIVLWLMSI